MKSKRVLIAEDNPGLAKVLSFKFKSCGFDVVTCGDGAKAWDAFQANEIDAVVSDHEMPLMSGVDLITEIRKASSDVPCFMVTGRQLELSKNPQIAELNVADIFAKPFSPGAVVESVNNAISQRLAARETAHAANGSDTSDGGQ
ncbi:MAG: response regulator [Planctomycetota bacterium]